MPYYECKRCFFQSNQRIGMIRHLNRKNKCIKNVISYKYSDAELYDLSLIRVLSPLEKDDEDENQDLDDDKDLENATQIIYTNEDDEIIIHHKKKDKKNDTLCFRCNRTFSTKGNLTKHLKKKCVNIDEHPLLHKNATHQNEKINENKKVDNVSIDNVSIDNHLASDNIKNTTNNIVYNQQIHNYNFYNIKYPIGFDKEWDLSKISNEKKLFLICCSNTKYSELLKYILQNDDNLNVIIEDDTNSGIVYKNDTEKFINMDKSDIIDQSLSKLNKQLNELCEEVIKKNNLLPINDKISDESIKINQKYNDYCKNESIKLAVKDIMTNIYNEKKDKTIEIMNTLLQKYNDNLIQDGNENGF